MSEKFVRLVQSWPSLVACVAFFGYVGYGVQQMGSASEAEMRKAMNISGSNDPRVVAQHENNKVVLAKIFAEAGIDEQDK